MSYFALGKFDINDPDSTVLHTRSDSVRFILITLNKFVAGKACISAFTNKQTVTVCTRKLVININTSQLVTHLSQKWFKEHGVLPYESPL